MQNYANNHLRPQKSFTGSVASGWRQMGRALLATGLFVNALTLASAQVVAPAPASPGALPTAPSVPGLPSRGATLNPGASTNPANRGSATQPGGTTTPANNSRGVQTPTQNQGTGRTAAQPTNQPSTNNGVPVQTNQTRTGNADRTAAPNSAQVDEQANAQDQRSDQEVAADGYEAARRREREETRRKLFGYSLFNDAVAANPFQPNLNIATPRNYVVGPGDQLNIRVYGYSEVDFTQTVSPEGYVYIAQGTGVGPVLVSGLTIEQAKTRIASRLATKFIGLRSSSAGPQNTYLEVTLGNIRSIRVTVTGEAVRPGTYTISSLSTVMNVVYQAGGPNELGSFRRVQLIRNNRVAATLDLYDYLLNGTQRNDMRLQDSDNIRFTTFIERVEITGTVKRNNIFEMLPGETLDRLLYYAGGFAANAYKGRVKVTRLTERERKVLDVTTPEFKTFVMDDGDVVGVEQVIDRFENRVTIEGAVYRPGQFSLDQNKTLKQLIQSAEGLRDDAFQGRVTIVRTRDDLAIENITVNVADILAGTKPDVPLRREDQVIIPSRFDLAEQATVSVQGEVNNNPGDVPYVANMTLDDLLLRAGGLRASAASSQVEVIRRRRDVDPRSASAQLAEVFRFDVDRDLSIRADKNKFVLEPFDQVVVRRSPNYAVQTFARVEGEVILPGSYAIQRKDQKVSDLVKLAGGLTPQAYVPGATLLRTVKLSADELARQQSAVNELANDVTKAVVQTDVLTPNKEEAIDINLTKILARPGSSEDILLQEGDVLRIPKLLETVRVQGEVLLPKTVKYRTGQTFQDYISDSGGFTSRSQRRRSFVVYANGSVDRTRKFMFFNIYPRVDPGSEVVVPRRTTSPLTPQQILSSTAGTISSLLSVIGLIIALSRVGR